MTRIVLFKDRKLTANQSTVTAMWAAAVFHHAIKIHASVSRNRLWGRFASPLYGRTVIKKENATHIERRLRVRRVHFLEIRRERRVQVTFNPWRNSIQNIGAAGFNERKPV